MQAQCKLLGLPRSSYYHRSKRIHSNEDEVLMQCMDRIYTEEPTFGTRRLCDGLQELGYSVGRDRVRRLMRVMGIAAIYPKPRLAREKDTKCIPTSCAI